MTRLFGIKNCDTVKKARAWLDTNGIAYEFHDFRADGLTLVQISQWLLQLGAGVIINKSSTTWKQLSPQQQLDATELPAKLILENPTLIKRPLLEHESNVTVGFKPENYARIFLAT